MRFSFPQENPSKKDVSNLHVALTKLKLNVSTKEVEKRELGENTKEAIKEFQRKTGIEANGELNLETVNKVKVMLEHAFFANSKTRTQKIQNMIERLGVKVAPEELKRRTVGESTGKAIRDFQAKVGLPADGVLSETVVNRLKEEAIRTRFATKTQVGQLHHTLLRAARIIRFPIKIDANELKTKTVGATTSVAVKAFQKKYGLQETGEINTATYDRMVSIVASRPPPKKMLKVKASDTLCPVKRVLRLNMNNKYVADLQRGLAFLGYKIDGKEFKAKEYGKTTREAVLAYERTKGLPVSGHFSDKTLTAFNEDMRIINPSAFDFLHTFRVRGTIRNSVWLGKPGVRVQVWEKLLRGEGELLSERKTLQNGFFDVPYDPPRDASNNQIKSPFHLQIKVIGEKTQTKVLFNPTKIAWVNFTEGEEPYLGTSEYDKQIKALTKILGDVSIADIEEKEGKQEITHLALNSGLGQEDVMQLALSHRAARELNNPNLPPEAFYAFIRQSLPSTLSDDLLNAIDDWGLIDQVVDHIIEGLVFLETDQLSQAFDTAAKKNLVPVAIVRQKDQLMSLFSSLRRNFALEKRILVGGGNLKTLLEKSQIDQQHYDEVANTFLNNRGLGSNFWQDLKTRANDFGGEDRIRDFEKTVQLGQMCNNHSPMLAFLKGHLSNQPPGASTHDVKDMAKLTVKDWSDLISNNGIQLPADIQGDTQEQRIGAYASSLAKQSERVFPAIALVSSLKRSDKHVLTELDKIQELVDNNPDLDLRSTNLDKFVKENNIALAKQDLDKARVMQRVHRLTLTSDAATALLDARIHSSSQIVGMGKGRFVGIMKNHGLDQQSALTIFGRAEFQYGQVLMRLMDYRFDLHRTDPQVIVKHNYTIKEQNDYLKIPSIETLFGSQDFCDCEHCQSVYGPPAYLADVLRFLENQDSQQPNKSVKDVLAGPERRPDLGNIILNCDNTEVPLPYIDLVCEILENAIPVASAKRDFSFQTSLSAEELRAIPQNVLKEAYNLLKTADYPIHSSFNLWQEETRVLLQHLAVKRYELMETFQDRPLNQKQKSGIGPGGSSGNGPPSDLSIAGEYWGMSSHETGIVVSPTVSSAAQDVFWGFDTTCANMPALDFIQHVKIEYADLLELLRVKWLNDPNAVDRMAIVPIGSCSLEEQQIVNFTLDKFDRIHRFIRLWRHTNWKMWELDLLIRAQKIGNGKLDSEALIRLKQFRQLQEKLGLEFEVALAFFNGLNTEVRYEPAQPNKIIQPLYARLFQNLSVTNPVDEDFWPLKTSEKLRDHKAVLLAALAITDEELLLLLERTDDKLNMANLSEIFNQVRLARSLNVSLKNLFGLKDLAGVDDVFNSPKQTLGFLEMLEWVQSSGFAVQELSYLLNYDPESPFGLREETITQYIGLLRESLRCNPCDLQTTQMPKPEQQKGQIISHIARTFSLTDEQSGLLLKNLNVHGDLIKFLSDPKLTEKNDKNEYTTEINFQNFTEIFKSYRLLHKASILVQRHEIANRDKLEWLLTKPQLLDSINLNELPTISQPAEPLFPQWLNLQKWLFFESQFPEPEGISLRQVFELAGKSATRKKYMLEAVSKLTNWRIEDLAAVHSGWHLKCGKNSDYKRVDLYIRLWKCFKQIERLGAEAQLVLGWSKRDNDANDAQFEALQQVRRVFKSKYDYTVWLSKITPFQDELREKKRNALTSYLVERSLRTEQKEIIFNGEAFANPKYWRNSDDLLNYFLIDVEMCARQLTSRIKQAISSVQMFVQRCFLNLEQPLVKLSHEEKADTVSLDSWKQWSWMKNYRIWEANRKVFLYPENWIEAELRDDKSPFFKELENEILQSEINNENVESAFRHYLEKIHEVSRLEIMGIYHELDDDNPYDGLPPNISILHVIGRTKSQPVIYYYRQFDLSYNRWTPWEKIDLEITGDHAIPVIYNRQLYLFWLIFIEKPQKVKKQPAAKPSDEPKNTPEPPNTLEIQVAWSIKKAEGWTPKKVSNHKLIHPWQRPTYSYHLRPRYKTRENLLWLDVYISMSNEFNNTKFYDPYKLQEQNPQWATAQRYDETARPWHSSSFLFDGDVIDLRLKPLLGKYRICNGEGILSENLVSTDSYTFVRDNFGERAKATAKLGDKWGRRYEIGPRFVLPEGMHYHNTCLANNKTKLNSNRLNVLENGSTRTLLKGAKSPFALAFDQKQVRFDTSTRYQTLNEVAKEFSLKEDKVKLLTDKLQPMYNPYLYNTISELATTFSLKDTQVKFLKQEVQRIVDPKWGFTPLIYQDNQRVFIIKPEWQETTLGQNETLGNLAYSFYPFTHQYTALFIRELNRSGVTGILNRKIQLFPEKYYPGNNFSFYADYVPVIPNKPDETAERDIVDFSLYGAYSIYNWEIFFHIPYLLACKLSQNQRFEEAMGWFHYIFDPTNTEALGTPQRYWVTKPFFEQNSEDYRKQRIEILLENINAHLDQVREWKNNPFKPHLIARYRPVAYQKTVVMKYISNLIAWGDQLFRRDTIESINEATTLYLLSYEILGRRPVKIPRIQRSEKSYNDLIADGALDIFGNKRAEVLMENFVTSPEQTTRTLEGAEPLPIVDTFYFGIPHNDELLKYWDIVEDRLFKIRHCMNIEGIVRQLPLFEPPINPALLVKAAAAGIDIGSVLDEITATQGLYRFRAISQKALEFCGEVRALGDKLLSVIEKRDAEGLALLRSKNEIELLKAVKLVKKEQINEANETWAGLEKAKAIAEEKKNYYESREFMNAWELAAIGLSGVSAKAEASIALGHIVAQVLSYIPSFVVGISGFGGSPQVTMTITSGEKLSGAAECAVNVIRSNASACDKFAGLATTVGSHSRRKEDWDFQKRLAEIEIKQLERQIEAARIRSLITERELENQELQIEQAITTDEYMHSKYTNQQLYDWMLTQLSTVYFQSYQLAYDMAKRAEKSYQFELNKTDSSFIQFGYWDSLKKGLLAGEKLVNDIHRMELSYIDQNQREFEITKHVSLAQFNPLSLVALKETGNCTVALPEWFYDMDYPGHYRRRIKSVSVTIPCVVGPYATIHCTLSLTKNIIRINDDVAPGYGNPDAPDDTRFNKNQIPTESIVTSHGQNDSGLFELNLNDERYLPFEGAGAISEWNIKLPSESNQFDFSTISDVILHVRYTAVAGSLDLEKAAKANLKAKLPDNSFAVFVLNHDFSSEWHQFFNPPTNSDQELIFALRPEHIPFFARNKQISLSGVDLILDSSSQDSFKVLLKVPGPNAATDETIDQDPQYNDAYHLEKRNIPQNTAVLGEWRIKAKKSASPTFRELKREDICNAYLIVKFSIKYPPIDIA